MAILHCSMALQLHSIFQAEFFGGIFVFLLQILAEFFNNYMELS